MLQSHTRSFPCEIRDDIPAGWKYHIEFDYLLFFAPNNVPQNMLQTVQKGFQPVLRSISVIFAEHKALWLYMPQGP